MTTPRTALITGASSGIGAATAAALAARGYRVIGTSRKPDAMADANRVPGVEYRALDLADPAAIETFAAELGEIDVLINNAGESQAGPFEELPIEAIAKLFQVNVFGQVRLTQLVLPGMRARGRGHIIMIGSMLASFPLAYRSSYVATKAALRGFADAMRREVSPFGIAVTTVEPGSIDTGISTRRSIHIDANSPYRAELDTVLTALERSEAKGISAEKVADRIVRVIESPQPFVAVGSRAPLLFALRRLLPLPVMQRIVAAAHGLK
ncbi:SDR family oxidoreductase [Nocardia sp. CDC159]|uniref:SDR family oxidoreductase n=1 Tax=Nocardia pulmonis TaxID=2951408 RepID=A0A9X2IWI6_9NOCA|nr:MULTISPECIES: SDR family oxidoreductase [Nocardia]MCM6772870.1 SDR family oxidoreductase [Nocardia pulmonis]MCM6785827.1 SDR family oxidoreductase [Nocardia sp. CDC159]